MAVNKVVYGQTTVMDITDTTATASDVLTGKYFYGNNGVRTQGSISSKSAQTYTPTTSDQTISSGQYLSGTQTIKGDANLIASNIKNGVSIFNVTGTFATDIRTVTTTPSSSASSISFTLKNANPLAFFVQMTASSATVSTSLTVSSVSYDGTKTLMTVVNRSNERNGETASWTRSGTTLTISVNSGTSANFRAVQYTCIAVY